MRSKKKPPSWLNIFNLPAVDLSDLEFLGLVDRAIVPPFPGGVEYRGSTWPAICLQNITLTEGELVQIVGRYNITLLVAPVVQSNSQKNINLPDSKPLNAKIASAYNDRFPTKIITTV